MSAALVLAIAVSFTGQVHFEAEPGDAPLVDPFAGKTEIDALQSLRAIEARLSLGQSATPEETHDVVAAAAAGKYVSVRALAAAVLAWLEPKTAVEPLLSAFKDKEARVRTVAAQSLLSLSRRVDEEQRRAIVTASLAALDDPSDEVACASGELIGALSPSAAADAMRLRADAAGDVRYACFSRIAGLPTRAVNVPPIPSDLATPPANPMEPTTPPATTPATPKKGPPDGTWLFVTTAASAGIVSGGVLPSGFLPSRDVLLYTESRTRLTHEEVAFPSQAAAGVVGGALLGTGAWALSTYVQPLDIDEAGAVAVGTGSLGLAGAATPLAFGMREGPGSFAVAGGFTLGLAATTGLAYGFHLDADDSVFAASVGGISALAAGTAVFAAVPVGLLRVGDAFRVDFGLGIIGMGAGVGSFLALSSGAFLDVKPARSFALVAGAAIGGGLALAGGFLLTPQSDIKSRIACGVGLGGEVIGVTAALFVPDDWLPHDAPVPKVGAAVAVDGKQVSLGIPLIVPVEHGLAVGLVNARF